MQDIYKYYYRFKKIYFKRLKEEFNESDEKINYTNIKEYDSVYSSFIKKLLFLFYNSDFDIKKIIEIRELLESRYILDRLKGLKDSKHFIKIEGEPKC